jgi:DNA-binding NtrC family response regulator
MSGNGDKKRILIIENGDEMGSLLEEYIKEKEYTIDSVESYLGAIEELSRKLVDVIIAHIQIPNLEDLKILTLLRKYQPDVSIIVVSNFEKEKLFHRTFEKGTNFFIQEPIDLEKLKLLIDDLVSSRIGYLDLNV